jgi:hypothetical protein
VLNLAGLWGGPRKPWTWIDRTHSRIRPTLAPHRRARLRLVGSRRCLGIPRYAWQVGQGAYEGGGSCPGITRGWGGVWIRESFAGVHGDVLLGLGRARSARSGEPSIQALAMRAPRRVDEAEKTSQLQHG